MLYFLRKRDSYFYIILTAFATLSSIYAVYLTADKFGKINFSQFAFFSIIVQIFFTLSDLGTKISYFKNSKTNKKNDYIYLLSSKLILALFLFIFTGFFNNSEIYFSFILTIIGTSIFPFALLQEYKLFCIIGLNNFFFRLIPLLFLSNISSIVQFSYVSGLTIFSFSIYMLIKLKVIKSNSFEFTQFRRYFMNLFIENKYLTGINIVSIIELNLHNIIAKLLFKVDDFADFIYLERYINYIKQGVIYFYEYLFPKIKLQNFKSYLYTMRYVYLLYIVFFAFIYLYFTYYNIKLFYGIKVLGYFYIFLIYPLFILIFNFIKSIIFCKYASDRNNFTVTIVAIVIKMSIIITLSKSFGIIIIPIALIFTEIFIGLTRARLLSIQIRSQL